MSNKIYVIVASLYAFTSTLDSIREISRLDGIVCYLESGIKKGDG